MFDYHECLKKGLIRKTTPSKGKARRSLEASIKWLEEAEKNYSINALRSSLLFNFFTSKEEVEETIEKSKKFVTRMKKLLEEKSKL
ncbi:MAG: hypothetical protein ACE5GI_04125 [Candidatus Aminicenantales bacterium]